MRIAAKGVNQHSVNVILAQHVNLQEAVLPDIVEYGINWLRDLALAKRIFLDAVLDRSLYQIPLLATSVYVSAIYRRCFARNLLIACLRNDCCDVYKRFRCLGHVTHEHFMAIISRYTLLVLIPLAPDSPASLFDT